MGMAGVCRGKRDIKCLELELELAVGAGNPTSAKATSV